MNQGDSLEILQRDPSTHWNLKYHQNGISNQWEKGKHSKQRVRATECCKET